jgi:CCR4-NOT transcription complex subunit 4
MGQYGHIDKISTNKNSFSNKNQKGPSFSTYISFSNDVEAALAILVSVVVIKALNNLVWNQRLIRSCYGTTKYCTFFLKKQECPNRPDCYFLHGLER